MLKVYFYFIDFVQVDWPNIYFFGNKIRLEGFEIFIPDHKLACWLDSTFCLLNSVHSFFYFYSFAFF